MYSYFQPSSELYYGTVDVIFVSKVYSRSTKYKTFLGLLPKDDVENEIMNLLRYFMIF